MKYRKLRIAWSVGWGVVAVLLVALWARSYWRVDYIDLGKSYSVSLRGNLYFAQMLEMRPTGASSGSKVTRTVLGTRSVAIADTVANPLNIAVTVPQLLVQLPVLLLVAAPWLRWSTRFSLRTLLIGMTVAAVILGLVIWAAK